MSKQVTLDKINFIQYQMSFFFSYELQKQIYDLEAQKGKIHEDTKEVNEKSSKLADEMRDKNEALKEVEK